VTDEVVKAVASGEFQFIRVNYANGDMVGHTGDYRATMIAVESVDLCLERVLRSVREAGGILVVTADHGNSDDMYMKKKGEVLLDDEGQPVPKTSHSLNPVIFAVCDPRGRYAMADSTDKPGLGNNASTIINLLGYEAPGIYLSSLVVPK
jgi:2,3-bisphosphoglycerate-independent phosphoglycerate mutase